MSLALNWMRPEAPYMPIATAGLLSALEDAGDPATTLWQETPTGPKLVISTDRSAEEAASAIVGAPWPDLEAIPWPSKRGQAIKPMLAKSPDPISELQRLRQATLAAGLIAETRLLNCLVTEAALDDAGVPARNRLLRGVKSDLSSIGDDVKLKHGGLAFELIEGPEWVDGNSGRGLGLVPELQTFGGTTGRDPSLTSVGNHSILLYRLLWLGLLNMPPSGVVHHGKRVVGGPLITDPSTISWPVWSIPLGLDELKTYFCLREIHSPKPDTTVLGRRGVLAVYRSPEIPISKAMSGFRWGQRVA